MRFVCRSNAETLEDGSIQLVGNAGPSKAIGVMFILGWLFILLAINNRPDPRLDLNLLSSILLGLGGIVPLSTGLFIRTVIFDATRQQLRVSDLRLWRRPESRVAFSALGPVTFEHRPGTWLRAADCRVRVDGKELMVVGPGQAAEQLEHQVQSLVGDSSTRNESSPLSKV